MKLNLPTEVFALIVMTLFFLFAWLPSSVAKAKYYGLKWLGSNRGKPGARPLAPWGERAERAYANLKDYYPAYVAGILILAYLDGFNEMTAICAWVFVFARILHFAFYVKGIVLMRALSFLIGLIVQTLMLGKALFFFL
jgi:uncharacterized MAPEG superfamily protein